MQKKYLEPWIRVQVFDEEMLTTDEWEDGADVRSALPEGDGSGAGSGSGDDLFDGLL